MIGALETIATLAVVAQVTAALPLGYHERHVLGWTLVAVSVPLTDYTVCLMDRPDGAALPVDGDVRETLVAGHPVERIDGETPAALIGRLLTHRADVDAGAASIGTTDRHVLALAGARWSELGANSTPTRARYPVLLLAGRDAPGELMETLIHSTGELPRVVVMSDEQPETAPHAANGWWRHVEVDSMPRVAIGFSVPRAGPEMAVAARIALKTVHRELAATRGRAVTRQLPVRSGVVHVMEWAMEPDSTPVVLGEALSALARLRRSTMDLTTFQRLRDAAVNEDREAIRRPRDRWFTGFLAAKLGGSLPRSAHEAGRVWERVTQSSIREAARAILPHAAIAVSVGTLGGERGAHEPTERWPRADVVYVDALEPAERSALAVYAVTRAADRLWSEGEPQALTTESEWLLARRDGPLSGRLVETLLFPDAIRRDYFPAGPELVFSSWLVADSLRAAIQGAPRDTLPGERDRLLDRREADAWNAVRTARAAMPRLAYEGAVHADGEVFQSLAVPLEAHDLRLWFSPETGLPARVFIDRGPGHVTTEYRFSSYSHGGRYRYPGRIERHVGARREAVLTVTSYAPATRLAASERLQ